MYSKTLDEEYNALVDSKCAISYDQYFRAATDLFEKAIQQHHFKLQEQLLKIEFDFFIYGPNCSEIFFTLKKLEHYFTTEADFLLSIYYRLLGHILRYHGDNVKSTYYYRLAIGHSIEHEDYQGATWAMINYSLQQIHTISPQALQLIAQSMPALLKTDNQTTTEDLKLALLFYIEHAISNGHAAQIEPLMDKLRNASSANDYVRYVLQMKYIESLLSLANNKPLQARDYLLEIIDYCLEQNNFYEILIRSYRQLVSLNLPENNTVLFQALYSKIQAIEKSFNEQRIKILDYLNKNHEIKSLMYNYPFGMSPDAFNERAEMYLRDTSQAGHTLVLIDCLWNVERSDFEKTLTKPDSQYMTTVLSFFNDEMVQYFGTKILATTLLNDMSLAYIIPLAKQPIIDGVEMAISNVRQTYPKQSVLKSISYAAVNNAESKLSTAEDCFYLAYALIYYEIH